MIAWEKLSHENMPKVGELILTYDEYYPNIIGIGEVIEEEEIIIRNCFLNEAPIDFDVTHFAKIEKPDSMGQ